MARIVDIQVKTPKVGLILSGGGARAAYQVGVLKAIAELLPKGAANPFPIICGTSAGAINSAALAIYARRFQEGVRRLVIIWSNFHVHQVFRADTPGVMANSVRWLAALFMGGMGKYNPVSLFDHTPLRKMLAKFLPLARIQNSIDTGALEALSITASSYTSGHSITFYQGSETLTPWERVRRIGIPGTITLNHLLASSAIPFVFSAVRIGDEYFGDGSMRQMAPISPALHLGAERVLVIGVRGAPSSRPAPDEVAYPSFAQIAGHVLNSIFLDSLQTDLERLTRINKSVQMIPPKQLEASGLRLKPVDVLVISPSEDLGKIAAQYQHALPRPVRFLLRGIGALNRESSDLVSYLLFEKAYCDKLIALGYADAMKRKDEVLNFLNGAAVRQERAERAVQTGS